MSRLNQESQRDAPQERRDLEKTLAALDEREAEELAKTWDLAAMAADDEPAPERIASARERFTAALAANGRGSETARTDRPRRARRMTSQRRTRLVAAAAAAVGLAVLLVILWPRSTTLTVPPGELADVTLPDGSRATLGAASTLTYRRGPLADARRVRLDGEAYFTIAPDDRSFRVETFNATVTALGTEFNVRAVEESGHPSTRVALVQGSVRVDARLAESVRLRPGEMTEVDAEGRASAPRSVPIEWETAWLGGGFAVVDQPLSAAIEDLARRFGVAIELQAEYLEEDTLAIHLPDARDAETVLADVCSVVGCQYTEKQDGFVVEARP